MWIEEQINFFYIIAPTKSVLPPSSLEDEQMFLRVDEVFALMSGERQADVKVRG